MAQELVSLIVPIYNVEKYLERCLTSIKNQTYRNIEVIMVNDGALDSSGRIAENYRVKDKRFLYIEKENGGLSSARNYGLAYVHGKYVSFIDPDDFISEDYVSCLLGAFGADTDIVIGDYVIYDEKRKRSYFHHNMLVSEAVSSAEEKKDLLKRMFLGYPVMSVWKNMYRVSFLRKNKLEFVSERSVYAEDALFHTEAYSLANQIRIIQRVVFHHRVVPGSLSQGYRRNFFEMRKELIKRVSVILNSYYDPDFVGFYHSLIPSTIGASMLAGSKCGRKEAVGNIRSVLSDALTVGTYRNNNRTHAGPLRYRVLYELGRLGSPGIVVAAAKTMLLGAPVYRRLQCKKEYVSS